MTTLSNKDTLLKELNENLILDGINFEDTSVGWYRISDLEKWAKDELPDYEGISLVSATKDNCIINCEGHLFEIFLDVERCGDEVIDSNWKIKHYSNENTELGG